MNRASKKKSRKRSRKDEPRTKSAGLPDLPQGLYEARGQVGFVGYQTNFYVKLVELYNPTEEEYCCKGNGMRHPAAGPYVRKTSVRKLATNEITKAMIKKWKSRARTAVKFICCTSLEDLLPQVE
jgi:hypothetical protein